jgi:signal transduction histidine kinase
MPAQQNETLNVVEVVELALDIFNENNILFEKNQQHYFENRRTQLVRIITNLVKNAIQSIPELQEHKQLELL